MRQADTSDTNEATRSGDAGSARDDAQRGILFIISSPSGGGKGTLIRRVLGVVPRLSYSVSYTTRVPRPGERHGVNYHFVSPEEFEEMRARGGFLEWARVHGNLYGTAWSAVERETAEGRDIVLEIDVQGATSVRRTMQDAVGIFILPPSYEVLRQRLAGRRTEDADALALRLRNARGEVEHYRDFDYVVLNDEADRAAAQLAAIVHAERARRARQEQLVRRVLATFNVNAPGD